MQGEAPLPGLSSNSFFAMTSPFALTTRTPTLVAAMTVAALVALSACNGQASVTPQGPRTAVLQEVTNRVENRPAEATDWQPAMAGVTIAPGGQVQTYDASSARLDIDDGTVIRMAPLSLFTLNALEGGPDAPTDRLTLALGKVFVVLAEGFGGDFKVETPVGAAAVRGSVMSVDYDPIAGSLNVACLTGHCSISDLAGTVTFLTEAQEAEIPAPGAPPSPPQPLSTTNLQDFGQLPEAVPVFATLAPTLGSVPTALPEATSVLPTPVPSGQPTLAVTPVSPVDLLTATPTPVAGGTASSVHVALPPIGCSGIDCETYCGSPPSASGPGLPPPPGPGTPLPYPSDPLEPTLGPGTPPPGEGTYEGLPPQGPHAAECDAFMNALIEQGVDFMAFRECLVRENDLQKCADASVRTSP